ncbi:Pkinase-domain-containing protein [Rhizodiscina lignyota]|uniref:Pkinase-domain-containing protein n=1 Tax=Rhizodiscina lignyota TaxID=1504668 RepID=A0A9P4I2E4_9PEZI|nr:Pkinase-domain-containing protein [Rhizodiscina lignyota]
MSTIQNLKNFIRHGKQARIANAEPTTNVSPVHAQQQRHHQYGGSPPPPQHYAISDPNVLDAKPLQGHAAVHGDYSAAAVDNRNVAARAGDAAARAVGDAQKKQAAQQAAAKQRDQDYDPTVIERIVAEERESKGKMPRYPGLERWTLVEKMGDGAFSNVYRARDTNGQYGEVAIKVVRKFEMNSSQRANILKEVQIMRQLDHPNIVKLIDFSEAKQYYYIILELCPGGELFHQIVRLTYFSEDLSRHVIHQVAKALEYLHEEAGVVHRDIKPENLLFYPIPFVPTKNPKPRGPDDEDKADEGEFIKGVGAGGIGVIKIADFGLSKVIWDSQTMTPCGTVGYTAPEIVKDERYSKSVDMWALGCVLYTLLCGFPPFYDESIQTLTEKVARGQYTFLSPWWDDISKPAQDLVSHLLTVDPEKRYDIKQFLAHPWMREALDEPTYAAHDAPPLATPLTVRQKELHQAAATGQRLQPDFAYLDETPGGARRMDFRSPGAVNLREVFDVGYAVHRQEEETKRRKNFKQGYRGGGAALNNLNALDEEEMDYDEDEFSNESAPYDATAQHPPAKLPKSSTGAAAVAGQSGVEGVERQMRNTSLSAAAQARQPAPKQREEKGYGQHSAAVAAAAKRQVRNKGAFELSLDNATLLGRRGKKGPASPGQGPGPSGLREAIPAGGS